MREIKDSGIEWIGQIPKEWNIWPTKRFFRHTKTLAGEQVDSYERLALTMNGVIKRSKDDSEGLQPEKFDTYQVLRENELLREENLKKIEEHIDEVVRLATTCNLSKKDIIEMVNFSLEEQG